MTVATEWLSRLARAGRLTGARPALWIPGAIAALVYVAWLPLVLAVATMPRVSDLAFVGAGLYTSSIFPLNVLLIAFGIALLVVTGCALAAMAEAVLLRELGSGTLGGRPERSLAQDAGVILGVLVIAALPVAAAAGAALVRLAEIGPEVFSSPDIGGPLLVRLARELAPWLTVLAVVLVLAQAWGAGVIRRAMAVPGASLLAAMRLGLGDLLARPARRVGLALVGTVADLAVLFFSLAVLRLVWAPTHVLLARHPLGLALLPLLLGFVLTWLGLVLMAGMMHAWLSTWWSLELGTATSEGLTRGGEATP